MSGMSTGNRQRARVNRLAAGSFLAAALLAAAPSAACPNCKEAVARDSKSIASGYNTSVLFMLGLVGVLGGSVAGLIAWIVRSEGDGSAARAVSPPPVRDGAGAERQER
jgi:hypothetical protein